MAGEEAISPRELAGALHQPLSNVSYHVRVLAECAAVSLVDTKPVRGSMQHFYRDSRSRHPGRARCWDSTAKNDDAAGESSTEPET